LLNYLNSFLVKSSLCQVFKSTVNFYARFNYPKSFCILIMLTFSIVTLLSPKTLYSFIITNAPIVALKTTSPTQSTATFLYFLTRLVTRVGVDFSKFVHSSKCCFMHFQKNLLITFYRNLIFIQLS
jgi:hypothetical protein